MVGTFLGWWISAGHHLRAHRRLEEDEEKWVEEEEEKEWERRWRWGKKGKGRMRQKKVEEVSGVG